MLHVVPGLVNPAAVELQPYGWLMIVMHYQGCFGSDCLLQVRTTCTCLFLKKLETVVQFTNKPSTACDPIGVDMSLNSFASRGAM